MQFDYNGYILIIEEVKEIDPENHYRASCNELNYYSAGFWNTDLARLESLT